MEQTPQDRGRAFESEVADDFGLERVPGSGNRLFKLDLTAGELRLSLKHTDSASVRVDERMLQELEDATSGPGGAGAHQTGALVVRIGALDRVVAVIDWQDLVALLKSDAVGSIDSTKDEQRRAAVELPTLLRE